MQDVYSSALYIFARFITDGFDLGTRTSRPAGTFEERLICNRASSQQQGNNTQQIKIYSSITHLHCYSKIYDVRYSSDVLSNMAKSTSKRKTECTIHTTSTSLHFKNETLYNQSGKLDKVTHCQIHNKSHHGDKGLCISGAISIKDIKHHHEQRRRLRNSTRHYRTTKSFVVHFMATSVTPACFIRVIPSIHHWPMVCRPSVLLAVLCAGPKPHCSAS